VQVSEQRERDRLLGFAVEKVLGEMRDVRWLDSFGDHRDEPPDDAGCDA